MTAYPFALPETVLPQLPPPSRDGYRYTDVCVGGKWDGVLVVDGEGLCVGISMGGRIRQDPLPFAADRIEGIRRASLWNRSLTSVPF